MTTHQIFTLSSEEATKLTPLGTHSGMDITIQNINAAGYIYIGGEDVTTTSYGFRLMHNQAISFELSGADSLYAVSSDADMGVAVIKVSLESGE